MVDMLRMNTTLVNLSGLGEVHTREVADVLRGNTTLKSLTFMDTFLRDSGVREMAVAMRVNSTPPPSLWRQPPLPQAHFGKDCIQGRPSNNSGLWTVSRDGRHNSEKTQEGSLNYAHLVKKNEFIFS